MKPVLVRNTLVFWPLLLAAAFGQDARRDPTRPGSAIEQRLAVASATDANVAPLKMKIKAIVLSDLDHGIALLETGSGAVTIPLHRGSTSEVMINGLPYSVKNFSRTDLQLVRSKE